MFVYADMFVSFHYLYNMILGAAEFILYISSLCYLFASDLGMCLLLHLRVFHCVSFYTYGHVCWLCILFMIINTVGTL